MASKMAFLLCLLFIVSILAQKQNVEEDAEIDAQRHRSRSHACFFARNAAQSVCVCHLARTVTSKFALATTTGRPKGVDQNALEQKHVQLELAGPVAFKLSLFCSVLGSFILLTSYFIC
ncbi:cytotoxic and regulatory T-cell molecule [Striga asiatica]|uniref:Cytotoxic and regulatory T-cell molecule n=1 Tax=Striga asiatica TaxID=4170 RepID=A0A5A7QLQ7_STRAF|nr:cytotoxic and regulatory T-cell molecule [Striga asiatica]